MQARAPIPILRMFDEAAARAFYVDFLGFRVDWEHRFEADLPLYMQLTLGDCVLHLSGHHGDATPGGHVRVPCSGLREFQQALLAKAYRHARPGVETQPWGLDMTVSDPFGNRLTFTESTPSTSRLQHTLSEIGAGAAAQGLTPDGLNDLLVDES